jgi:hypothetical protein
MPSRPRRADGKLFVCTIASVAPKVAARGQSDAKKGEILLRRYFGHR